jgi:hypothetical protein
MSDILELAEIVYNKIYSIFSKFVSIHDRLIINNVSSANNNDPEEVDITFADIINCISRYTKQQITKLLYYSKYLDITILILLILV